MRYAVAEMIRAGPEMVWEVLADLPGWSAWNTAIVRTKGVLTAGARVAVEAMANPGRALPVRIVELEPGRRMVWTAGLPFGLFHAKRTFTVEPKDGGTLFEMVEEYSGVFADPITKRIPDLQASFEEFARCLRTEAERRSGQPTAG
jgi:hypothetical protein